MTRRPPPVTTSTTQAVTTTTVAPSPLWTDVGCYQDASIHPLQTQLPSPGGSQLSRQKCSNACWGAGCRFSGLKAGVECWCGQYVQGDLSSSPADCNMPCPGNSSETCGGAKVFNVVAGNEPPYSYIEPLTPTSTVVASSSSVSSSVPGASQTAFVLMSHYHGDCTGDVNNEVMIRSNSDGMCIDTNCQVASLDIASLGDCPDGQVQISYWQQPGCSGKWYGYGYTSRSTCRSLWSDGWSFKSLWLRCAKESQDCVRQGTCNPDAETTTGICNGANGNGAAAKAQNHQQAKFHG